MDLLVVCRFCFFDLLIAVGLFCSWNLRNWRDCPTKKAWVLERLVAQSVLMDLFDKCLWMELFDKVKVLGGS
jgi:hypothetical protein